MLDEIRFLVENGKMTNLCPDQKCLGLLSTQRQRVMRKLDKKFIGIMRRVLG